jgi:hypothetical protein
MGVKPLLPQCRALGNPKAVLLIDHRQPQARELNPLLNKGMSADNNVYITTVNKPLDFLLPCLAYAANK